MKFQWIDFIYGNEYIAFNISNLDIPSGFNEYQAVSCNFHRFHGEVENSSWQLWYTIKSQIAKFMQPTCGPTGSCRPQMGPMLAPWTLLSAMLYLLWQNISICGCVFHSYAKHYFHADNWHAPARSQEHTFLAYSVTCLMVSSLQTG